VLRVLSFRLVCERLYAELLLHLHLLMQLLEALALLTPGPLFSHDSCHLLGHILLLSLDACLVLQQHGVRCVVCEAAAADWQLCCRCC
jgi:hypothetical protein